MEKTTTKIILLYIAIILGIYLYVQYLFLPQLDRLRTDYANLTEGKEKLADMTALYPNLTSLKQEVEELRIQAEVLEAMVPKAIDKPNLMITIYDLAKKNSLTPIDLGFGAIEDKGDYLIIPLNLSCSGSANSIYRFTEELSLIKSFIISLEQIDIPAMTDNTTIQLKMIAYTIKP